MSFTLFPGTRLALARDSLAGLSVGDALGGPCGDRGVRAAEVTHAHPEGIADGVAVTVAAAVAADPAW